MEEREGNTFLYDTRKEVSCEALIPKVMNSSFSISLANSGLTRVATSYTRAEWTTRIIYIFFLTLFWTYNYYGYRYKVSIELATEKNRRTVGRSWKNAYSGKRVLVSEEIIGARKYGLLKTIDRNVALALDNFAAARSIDIFFFNFVRKFTRVSYFENMIQRANFPRWNEKNGKIMTRASLWGKESKKRRKWNGDTILRVFFNFHF